MGECRLTRLRSRSHLHRLAARDPDFPFLIEDWFTCADDRGYGIVGAYLPRHGGSDAELVGVMELHTRVDMIVIRHLYVAPAHRRRGVGTELVKYAYRYAWAIDRRVWHYAMPGSMEFWNRVRTLTRDDALISGMD